MKVNKIAENRVVVTIGGKDIFFVIVGEDVQISRKDDGFISKRDFAIAKSAAKKILLPRIPKLSQKKGVKKKASQLSFF